MSDKGTLIFLWIQLFYAKSMTGFLFHCSYYDSQKSIFITLCRNINSIYIIMSEFKKGKISLPYKMKASWAFSKFQKTFQQVRENPTKRSDIILFGKNLMTQSRNTYYNSHCLNGELIINGYSIFHNNPGLHFMLCSSIILCQKAPESGSLTTINIVFTTLAIYLTTYGLCLAFLYSYRDNFASN